MRNTGGVREPAALVNFLENQRKAREWSKAELARQLDVDRTTVFRWLRGDIVSIQPESIERMAEVLDADYDELLAMAGIRSFDGKAAEEPEPDPADDSAELDELKQMAADMEAQAQSQIALLHELMNRIDRLGRSGEKRAAQ